MIGLLIEKQLEFTDAEADALVDLAKRRAEESGRSVRAEAERLLSDDRGTRLRDLSTKVEEASGLLAAIARDVDDLRAGSDGDDDALSAVLATLAAACAPFCEVPGGQDGTSPGN